MAVWYPPPHFRAPLTVEQISSERSVEEFQALMDEVSNAIRSDRDCGLWVRHNADQAAKVFCDELTPLSAFLMGERIPQHSKIVVPADDGPADAILKNFRDDGSNQPLQITNSAWEHQDALRMERLTREGGSVNAFNPISRNRRTGEVSRPSSNMVNRESIHAESIRRVREVILRKISKIENYERKTWLIVQMDDPLMTDKHRSIVCEAAASESQGCGFERVYVVSPNQPVFSSLVWSR